MKKLILLASIIMLVGIGCVKTPKQKNNNQAAQNPPAPEVGEIKEKKTRPPETNISAENNTEFANIFTTKSEEIGFKVYYPAFIPNGFKLNTDSLSISNIGQTGKLITYNLSDANAASSSLIYVQEQIEGMELDKNIAAEQEVEYLKGYIKTININGVSFYILVFLKDEKNSIRISARTDIIDKDTLSKIAESMK